MLDCLKKITFLSLILSLFFLLGGCRNENDECQQVQDSLAFFIDFENECENSMWKNIRRIENDTAYSGKYVCECTPDMMYAFGINFNVDNSIGKSNASMSVSMMINARTLLNSKFVVSIEKDNKTILWKSFPLSDGFIAENQWYENSFSFNIPNDLLKNSKFNCYILNDSKEYFKIDDFCFNLKYFNLPAYIKNVKEYDIPKDLRNIENSDNINLLYSEKEKQILIADDENNIITKPLSLYYSLIINGDTLEMQNSRFDLTTSSRHFITLLQPCRISASDLYIRTENNNVNFNLETKFNEDVKVLKLSLIIPFLNDDFTIYRRNPFVDSCDYQDVYYLDQEGFSLNFDERQLNLYHPDNVSSIQLDVKNMTAHINMDYYYDHLLMRYELLDTVDYYVDNSSTFVKKNSSIKSSFTMSLTDKTYLPRIMPVYDGYESAFIWTEHADWTDIKTHRATYFGSEDIKNIEDATGGFAYYDIPVTKSVFYNNPDSVTNYEKNPDFPGLHSTIKTDDSFFDFLKQLRDNGFDICLHTPEQYTTTIDNLKEALSFMKENFASPSWIDHGYNNGIISNREDLVCDALDSTSQYYTYDLWKENGVKYLFNASYEEMRPRPFVNYIFENNLMRPYPGFGDALPVPKISRLYSYPDIMLWSTPYTLEPGENWGWNYYLAQERLDKIVDFRYVFITHFYAPWVQEKRGYWETKNGKIVAKDGLNDALQRIALMRDEHLLLPMTVADYMTYQQQIRNLEYRVNEDGSVTLKNNNNETIKGLSLISVKEMSLANAKSFNMRKTKNDEEYIIWFDMKPNEELLILINN